MTVPTRIQTRETAAMKGAVLGRYSLEDEITTRLKYGECVDIELVWEGRVTSHAWDQRFVGAAARRGYRAVARGLHRWRWFPRSGTRVDPLWESATASAVSEANAA